MKHLRSLPVKGTDTAALFGTERIGKILLKIAPPVMLAQLILALYNVVDSYFVGRYSDDGLTALSVIYPIQLFITALAVGTGVGVNTLMARRYAHEENDEADKTAGIGMVLALASWAVFATVSVFIMEPFVRLCTSSPQVIRDAVTYGRIVSIGSIGVYLEGCFTKVHQASGNMTLPTVAQVVGALTYRLRPAVHFRIRVYSANGCCRGSHRDGHRTDCRGGHYGRARHTPSAADKKARRIYQANLLLRFSVDLYADAVCSLHNAAQHHPVRLFRRGGNGTRTILQVAVVFLYSAICVTNLHCAGTQL